ncbi:lysophospholipid acyltransferase family protein [Geobacter sp. AOG2]|uniref:lysophospholipid acyltransferase family protein n=1 Tax=Geobacter sp. AOG2 TaxID=1566347 RepID=UPI00208C4691|nr:lysophospholipid acyltransferase family protein [Geobacter sp. AOG2]GFE61771.1 lipid A biosynthesis acyltransferase [Geobacter sp. AOG2]
MLKHIFWAIQTAVIYCLTLAAALLPASLTCRLGALAGLLIPYIVPKRRAVIIDNINHSLPFMKAHRLWNSPCDDAPGLARETFKNLGRSLMEICRLYHGRGVEVIDNIEIRGWANYEAARAKGKGLIFLSGHCGNWELMSLTLSSLFGKEVSGVARRQNNPYLNSMVERMRSRFNSRLIYKQGALKGILAALRNREMVGILADQAVFPEEGYLIDVLGRKAWGSKAPVIIAKKSGVPLVPVFLYREGERHVLSFYPEHLFSGDMSDEGIQEDTQALSRYVEDFVVSHPTQWYWVHRRWKRAGAAA